MTVYVYTCMFIERFKCDDNSYIRSYTTTFGGVNENDYFKHVTVNGFTLG